MWRAYCPNIYILCYKVLCVDYYKFAKDKADQAETKLSEKGHDINRKTLNQFYEENRELYRSVQRAKAKYLAKDPRELSPELALGKDL